MNTATFRRSKKALAAWVLGPPVFIFMLHYIGLSHSQLVAEALLKEQQLKAAIPQLESKLSQASSLSRSFIKTDSSQERTVALLTTHFHKQARLHHVDIHTFSSSLEAAEGSTLSRALVFRIRGEATLPDFIHCLDALQQHDRLFSTTLADLRILSLYPEPRYMGNFVLHFHAIPTAADSGGQREARRSKESVPKGGVGEPG